MVTGGNRKLSGWLNDFVNHLANNDKESKAVKKEAEINVKDLPKIVWNDETFYVMFDEDVQIATVFNEFGNTVTTLQGISTIDEVDKALNSKQVVVGKQTTQDVFEEELSKVSAYLKEADGEDNNMTNTTPDLTPEIEQQDDNDNEVGFDGQPVNDNEGDSMVTNAETKDDNMTNTTSNPIPGTDQQDNEEEDDNSMVTNAEIEDEIEEIEAGFAQLQPIEGISNVNEELYDKIASLENKINKLVEALSEQEFARSNQQPTQEDLNIGAEDEEVNHFNETAQESARKIELEHQVDISTPEGRVSLVDQLRNEVTEIMDMANGVEMEEVEELTTNVTEDDFELEIDNDIIDESDMNEDLIEIEDSENGITDVNPEDIDLDKTLKDEDNLIEVEDNKEIEDKEDEELEEEYEEEITQLSSRDSKIFKNAICPKCGDLLVKTRVAGVLQGIKCNGECETEYAVNTKTEEIYKHK
ncbi:MAG: hypothetical protein ACOCRK_01650 [bacterium]